MYIILADYKPFIEKFKLLTDDYVVIDNYNLVEKHISDTTDKEIVLINPYISLQNDFCCICKEQFETKHSFYLFNCLGFRKPLFGGGVTSATTVAHYIMSVKNRLKSEKAIVDNNDRTYSLILPFMFNGDRFPLFKCSLESIIALVRNKTNWEICIHETGPKQYLNLHFFADYGNFNLKYKFTKYERVFHRAWALNVAAKYLATNDYLILGDADLIYTKEWFDSIQKVNQPCAGWEKCNFLSQEATEYYFRHKQIMNDYVKTNVPCKANDAGKITFIPKKIFFDIHGVPEHFKDTYGGEDNALAAKLEAFGYPFHGIKDATIFHLNHDHKTLCDTNITKQAHDMLWKWTKQNWLEENKKPWGQITYPKLHNNKEVNILWAKHNRIGIINSHLLDSLQQEMQNHFNITFVENNIPENMTLGQYNANVFYNNKLCKKTNLEELYNTGQYNVIIADTPSLFVSENFKNMDCLKIGLIEDLQASLPIYNFLEAQKFDIILNRYKNSVMKVCPDLLSFSGKIVWMPHAIDTTLFKYEKRKKKYDAVLLGESWPQIYPKRDLAINKLHKFPWFKRFPRPRDFSTNPFPVGKDYIRVLNESKIGITCGSIYHYPIMKFMEFPACGALLYADYFPELQELGYIPGKNMIEFNENSIISDVEYWRTHDDEREAIVENGVALINKYHSTEYRAKELSNVICDALQCSRKFPEIEINNYVDG